MQMFYRCRFCFFFVFFFVWGEQQYANVVSLYLRVVCNKLCPFGDQSLDLNCTSERKKKMQLSSLLLVARPSAGRTVVKFTLRTANVYVIHRQ